jgi:hypothetical protein
VREGLCVCVWDADTVNEALWDCDRDCVDEGVIVALELCVALAVTVCEGVCETLGDCV